MLTNETLRVKIAKETANAKTVFEMTKTKFTEAAAINPISAMNEYGWKLAALQGQYHDLYAVNSAIEFAAVATVRAIMTQFQENFENVMVETMTWRPQSSCPMTNLTSQAHAQGTCAVIRILRRLLDETA